nr:ABC-2 family transporter protein [Paenibacillus thiaminolyticus]
MSRIEYKLDFITGVIGVLILNVTDLLLIGILLSNFHSIGGWSVWQIVFLYSFYLAAMGLQNIFTLHLNEIENYVQDGTFDQFLVRPIPPFLQLIAKEINHKNFNHLIIGIIGLVISYQQLNLNWSFGMFLWFILLLLSGALVLAGIVLGLNSLAFWTVKSNVFIFGTGELQEAVQHYPLKIFGKWFEAFLTFLLPFGFINYYPSLILLDKTQEALNPIIPYLTPIISVVILLIGFSIWSLGIKNYQSTGT